MSDNIKVIVKVRPLISREIEDKLPHLWRVKNNTLYQLDQNGKDLGQVFTFDKVYAEDTKTPDVYNDIAKPIVEAATAGFNGTIFAYGQTSSGKTYTMTGTEESPGIIPLSVLNLFEIIKNIPGRDFLVRVSYIEIYNETVKDLLCLEKNNIPVHDTLSGLKVDCTEKVASSPEEVLEAMRQGEANRQTGATNMNEMSSRSHSIFQITIESREHTQDDDGESGCVNVSQLNLVDLAGSERAGQTGATGLRFKEGTHINKSLSALALVIKQLSEDPKKHVNYRDCKLTRILQNSLGGNAKTSIICAVTPVAAEETISTLQFANRAKAIKNKPEVNAVATNATMIQCLTKQMSKLQLQLESKKNLEQDNFNLQKQINALQKLILNGFGQRQSVDMMLGPKRKLQQPRRVTIHSTVTERDRDRETVVQIPKFITPSLKYNPTLVGPSSEFEPIHRSSNVGELATVPEEPARLITPPPPHKSVYFNDDVINLDSDDDAVQELETCSPIHKCYGASKTPPCILRKNCKIAEKNLKDIVELTEIEKLFPPSAVELMQKLENNSQVVAQLQDEMQQLNKVTKEKDLQIDMLKSKLEKKDSELKLICAAKDDLQTECENCRTKLTELEVIYETLKNKSKLREQELLSLIDEINVKQLFEGGHMSRILQKEITFMDMSKDISLVNSETENSIVPDDAFEDVNKLMTDTQEQLTLRNQNIVELEANLFAHEQKIASLESFTEELEQTVSTLTDGLRNSETENAVLKSSIGVLNTTINDQRESLETATKDIESYNTIIQELKMTLTKRESFSSINIDDSFLENMIANEEHFIANNENIMNVIHCLKIAVDTRNKQIAELKDNNNKTIATENENLRNQLLTQTEQIRKLKSIVEDLRKQINENISTITKLNHENNNYQLAAQELCSKIDALKTKNQELEQSNDDNIVCKEKLEEELDRLKYEYVNSSTDKMAELTTKLEQKEDLIVSLNKEITQSKEVLCNTNIAALKALSILGTLTGNMQEVPAIMDNFVNVFNVLSNSLTTLEIVASNIVSEKDENNQTIENLEEDLKRLYAQHNSEVAVLQNQITDLNKLENNYIKEIDLLTAKLNEAIELRNLEISISVTKQEQYSHSLAEKDGTINTLTMDLKNIESQVNNNISKIKDLEIQLNNARKEKHHVLKQIFKEITDIAINFHIDNFSGTDLTDSVVMYDYTLQTITKIADHITFITKKNVDDDNNETSQILSNNKVVTQSHCDSMLISSNEMKTIASPIKENPYDSDKQTKDLIISAQILQDLHKELQNKATQLLFMEEKVEDWKTQFDELSFMMKNQMESLKIDNASLKTRIQELELHSKLLTDSDYKSKIDTYKPYNAAVEHEIISPPSLVTICCDKLVNVLDMKQYESQSTVNNFKMHNKSGVYRCYCHQLKLELENTKQENAKLLDMLAEMEQLNQYLSDEQEVARSEIQFLLQRALELQKKIMNHKTNLSILTATSYAENKSLQSQVKVLQHHHKRFHNVCQRDIPDVKKQLTNLMSLIKGDVSFNEPENFNLKQQSLSDVLDSSTTVPYYKNESTLDDDILMLDTNITMTTDTDKTLTGHEQTCLDMTQLYIEASSAAHCPNEILQKISMLEEENNRLQELVNKHDRIVPAALNQPSKPLDNGDYVEKDVSCAKCKELTLLKESHRKINEKLKHITQDLIMCKSSKEELQQKLNITVENTTIDALYKKISIFEKEYSNQKIEISKLHDTISFKNKDLKDLQEENDALSNQVMDNVSEVDDLTKIIENLKKYNSDLQENIIKFEKYGQYLGLKEDVICSQCTVKDKVIEAMQSKKAVVHANLNRSLSDSDSSSRFNKICTLQNELYAGKQDCEELTEDVVTIKNHLERSGITNNLNENASDSNIGTLPDESSRQSDKYNMPDIPEEHTTDVYMAEKMDCFNYYAEKTGVLKNTISSDTKIVEIMKCMYENLMVEHGNELENLNNKLNDYEKAKYLLQSRYNELNEKYSKVTKDLHGKNNEFSKISKTLSDIKNNIAIINKAITNDVDTTHVINMLRNVFVHLDSTFDISSVKLLEYVMEIVTKNQTDLSVIIEKNTKLQIQIDAITTEFNSVKTNLDSMKLQLSSKEEEYELLNRQKDKIHEINSLVTLDVVKREKELKDTIDNGYRRLIELEIIKSENIERNSPLNTNIKLLFDLLVGETRNQNTEIDKLKLIMDEKQKEIENLTIREEKLQQLHSSVAQDLVNKENINQTLSKLHDSAIQTAKFNVLAKEKLLSEVDMLKKLILDKESTIDKLETVIQTQNNDKISLLESMSVLQSEVANLKRLNDMINSEKDSYATELKRSAETIQKNNIDINKMTSDILVLRESLKQDGTLIENMKTEAHSLLRQIIDLKEQVEKKNREYSRLETNIKTHEKTAQIQTKMIMRLDKQKIEDDKKLEELTEKYTGLQKESKIVKTEINQLRIEKEELQVRVNELVATLETHKNQPAIDSTVNTSRRRRQSIHDTKRTFAEGRLETGDHQSVDSLGLQSKTDYDMSIDNDNADSNRSTPIRLSKGRNSSSFSRTDQSDNNEEQQSRPSSVLDSRRRRQSLYDAHRGELTHASPPTGDNESSVSQLKEQLAACQQELQDLQEKYTELDEECETCSEYFRDSEERCSKLKKEKLKLEDIITELKSNCQSSKPMTIQTNASQVQTNDASVNTDEDWANLHSVVVDRMSYNMEVEKNKKLTKSIEQIRFEKQDLKKYIANMQKALDRNNGQREVEALKYELAACKQELSELQQKYKDLDEECETCAQRLHEKDEQCRKLRDAKAQLEAKLQELSELTSISHTVRKKRQNVHDQNRPSNVDAAGGVADTSDGNIDCNINASAEDNLAKEVKHLKLVVESLSRQKFSLEQQLTLATVSTAYVATGSAIVQNQQITDVMRENKKLKKQNAKLVNICQKRGKSCNRENEDPANQG